MAPVQLTIINYQVTITIQVPTINHTIAIITINYHVLISNLQPQPLTMTMIYPWLAIPSHSPSFAMISDVFAISITDHSLQVLERIAQETAARLLSQDWLPRCGPRMTRAPRSRCWNWFLKRQLDETNDLTTGFQQIWFLNLMIHPIYAISAKFGDQLIPEATIMILNLRWWCFTIDKNDQGSSVIHQPRRLISWWENLCWNVVKTAGWRVDVPINPHSDLQKWYANGIFLRIFTDVVNHLIQ